MRWRFDERCGPDFPLSDGTPAECDPDGEKPCCMDWPAKACLNAVTNLCQCSTCVDYRTVREIRKTGQTCAVAKVGGFLKNVCFDEKTLQIEYKCLDSPTRYTTGFTDNTEFVSDLCETDPFAYQACGLFSETKTTNRELFCGGYLCGNTTGVSGSATSMYRFAECHENCSFENRYCPISRDSSTPCDDTCSALMDDSIPCRDEDECGGFRYGTLCKNRMAPALNHITPVFFVCDGKPQCGRGAKGQDEKDCSVNENTPHTCTQYLASVKYGKNLTVPIRNYTRCSYLDTITPNIHRYPYCLNYLDHTNCSDAKKISGQCSVNGFMSNISKYVVCDSIFKKTNDPISLCDDGLENACMSPSSSENCRVHKHKMCNGVNDCVDKSDENQDDCSFSTKHFQCERSFYSNRPRQLPLSWILDDQTDCLNGDDENHRIWLFCGTNHDTRRVKLPGEICEDVFQCVGGSATFVRFDNLCDGVESCGMENKVCYLARDFPIINSTAIHDGPIPDLCESQQFSEGKSCSIKEFKTKNLSIFGVAASFESKIRVPNSKVHCNRTFGEYYVYLSCMGLCLETNAQCPLNVTKPLMYYSCPTQYPDRVLTVADNSYLTFVTEQGNGLYHQPNPFQCNNSRCIEHRQVCDLIDDCGDASDEVHCANHIVCKNTVNKSKKHRISIEQQCDGIYDCFDFSDECNEFCDRQILESFGLKCLCWVVGTSAIFLNTVTVVRGFSTLNSCETESLLITKTLVNIIGCGDLLIGIYLTSLSVFDSVIFRGQFCKHQAEWLTGTACSVLGVISTIGSQLSLFAMSALSIIRVHGIVGNMNSMSAPRSIDRRAAFTALLSVIAIVITSIAIALTPLLPSLEDYFVQGMFYDPDYKLFIGFPDKARHLKILEAYFNNSNEKNSLSINTATNLTWKEIGSLVDKMFTKDYGTLTRSPIHFYGNDGVCLFKYFVRSDDARRSRQTVENVTDIVDHKGNLMVWLMLGINLFCVILISACYVLLNIIVRKSSKDFDDTDEGASQAKHNSEVLQKRITILIASDFLCWTPFIIISALHNLKYIDATQWYVAFAITLLPINSVVNPLIYDIEFGRSIFLIIVKIRHFMGFIRRRWQRRGQRDNDVDEIEEHPTNHQSSFQTTRMHLQTSLYSDDQLGSDHDEHATE